MTVTNTDKHFYLSDNGKTKFTSTHRNTFGLTHGLPTNGGTCPGATLGAGGCLDVRDGKKRATCYMEKVVQIYKAVGAKLAENTEMVTGQSYETMVQVIRNTVKKFTEKTDKKNWFMRLHYSGDFFSVDYSKAWAQVIKEYPEVRFWVYTRSHNMVQYLVDCTNLTLYLSVDPVNIKTATKIYEQFKDRPNVGMAWLGTENTPKEYRWVVCPETSGIIQNTKDRGACAKCRLCVDRYKTKVKNIAFKIH